jgi:hypothetical protein
MRVHLMADVVLGLFLAVSPWLLDYDQIVWAPHLIVGLVLVGSGLLTRRVAAGARDSHHHPGRPLHH